MNHTLLPFQSGPVDGVNGGVGNSKSLSTLVRPGHRVLLDAGLEECVTSSSAAASPEKISSFRNVWCTGGQVRSCGTFFVDVLLYQFLQSFFVNRDGRLWESKGQVKHTLSAGMVLPMIAKDLLFSHCTMICQVKIPKQRTHLSALLLE